MSKTSPELRELGELIEFICPCGKVYKKTEEESKWSPYWMRCECGDQARTKDQPVRGAPITKV